MIASWGFAGLAHFRFPPGLGPGRLPFLRSDVRYRSGGYYTRKGAEFQAESCRKGYFESSLNADSYITKDNIALAYFF